MEAHFLNRRDLLRLCGAGGAVLLGGNLMKAEKPTPAVAAVDHLLVGSADLDQASAWLEDLTGVRALRGGSHPGAGTRNALLSLGGRQYLELIAPDPEQTAYNFHIDVRELDEPRLITWAAATTDIEAAANQARDAGYSIFGPAGGSRVRPDGRVLRWKTLGVLNPLGQNGVEPVPFFIEWAADSRHPAHDSPGGCRLKALAIEHPDPPALIDLLIQFGIEAAVSQAENVRLAATIETPKGTVELR